MSASTDQRPCGRPRSVEADQAILDATLDLFATHGYDGLRIEAVAEQAGVAKTTVYRRWPNKLALLLEAIEHVTAPTAQLEVDTGSLEGDLREMVERMRRSITDSPIGRIIPASIAAGAQHPELAQAHRDLVARRRTAGIAAVKRAMARGEAAPDLDPEMIVDMVVAPVFYRTFVSGRPTDDGFLTQLVRRAVAAAQPLSSPTPISR